MEVCEAFVFVELTIARGRQRWWEACAALPYLAVRNYMKKGSPNLLNEGEAYWLTANALPRLSLMTWTPCGVPSVAGVTMVAVVYHVCESRAEQKPRKER